MLGWSKAAILSVCGMTVGLQQAPWPPVHRAGTELRAGDVAAPSPAYTETNCSCSQFTCGGVDYPACSSVCTAPKHACASATIESILCEVLSFAILHPLDVSSATQREVARRMSASGYTVKFRPLISS